MFVFMYKKVGGFLQGSNIYRYLINDTAQFLFKLSVLKILY